MKSTNLRLLLHRGGSRRLFFVSVIGATIWSAIIVVSALVLARVIVAVINLDSSAISLIGLLAGLWDLSFGVLDRQLQLSNRFVPKSHLT